MMQFVVNMKVYTNRKKKKKKIFWLNITELAPKYP